VQVNKVRLWTAPDHTRIVFDLNSAAAFQISKDKKYVNIDIEQLVLMANLSRLPIPDSVVSSMKHYKARNGWHRIRIRVLEEVQPKAFLIQPRGNKPYRLVLDLVRHAKHGLPDVSPAAQASGKIIVAVDAGHGGEDPGALGHYGLQEKKVTLAVAKKLVREINKHPRMHAFLTRKGDYFVPLRKRILLARKGKADLMISIHADAVVSGNARGASVYTLSEKGASDKMAAMLAKKENAADRVGGVMPSDVKDPVVKQILADLMKRASLNSALQLADEILLQIRKVGPIKYKYPKSARFVVLGAAEIPSVLVELDYISHPKGEKLLRRSAYQQKLASALKRAMLTFLNSQGRLEAREEKPHTFMAAQKVRSRPPAPIISEKHDSTWKKAVKKPSQRSPVHDVLTVKNQLKSSTLSKVSTTNIALQRGFHIVGRGDTLWNVSQRFHTSVATLRRLNGMNMKHSQIKVGQRLRLP